VSTPSRVRTHDNPPLMHTHRPQRTGRANFHHKAESSRCAPGASQARYQRPSRLGSRRCFAPRRGPCTAAPDPGSASRDRASANPLRLPATRAALGSPDRVARPLAVRLVPRAGQVLRGDQDVRGPHVRSPAALAWRSRQSGMHDGAGCPYTSGSYHPLNVQSRHAFD
jgi:hypothetical protein